MALAGALAGQPVGAIAEALAIPAPASARSGKGWTGSLLEIALGAAAGNDAAPDFPELGVELKTVPLRGDGRPAESTWVTRVPLDPQQARMPWQQSVVCAKLSAVLFVPIEAQRDRWLDRRVGRPRLWRPTEAEAALLRSDYEEIMARVLGGRVDEIDARVGGVLQVRPKGRDSTARSAAVGADGHMTWTGSRGFYLRPTFVRRVLNRLSEGRGHFPPPARGATLGA
ncbi:MAG: DNA mismatch repair protein MutH [Deltaproteobacteria bacterium]|nr:DNA mismatch repair protein MutH [Deltaproteobacteria bacterium]